MVDEPNRIADLIEVLKPFPDGTHAPTIENANDILRDMAVGKAHEIYGDPLPDVVQARLDRELKSIIGKYSDHISLPILMEKEEWKDGENDQPGDMVKTGEWETVNQASALWTRPKKDISDEQYAEFYKAISHDHEAPLTWSHNRVEGNTEYTQLLYVPAKAPFDLWNRDKKAGVKLYVKRVFIMDDAEALMPSYLRFVKGVIDSADLPLNVSRELLQESRDVRAIREGSTKRVLSMLEDLAKHDKHDAAPGADGVTDVVDADDKAKEGKYSQFYAEFGAVLKEGLGEDFANRDRLAKLLRYASTQSDTATVSFADYKARMKEGQDAIYYITADTLAAAKNSPQLEVFKKKGIEVLLMTDRVDEWSLNYLHEFDGTPLQSVAKGAVDLGDLQDEAEAKAAEAAAGKLREDWAIGGDAIANLTELLEDHGIKVALLDGPEDFDGACAATHDEQHVLIALNRTRPGERMRFTAAHELGHWIMGLPEDMPEKEKEACCHRFAGAFLYPREQVVLDFGGHKRSRVHPVELLNAKRRYGVSMQVALRRLKYLELLSDAGYRSLFIQFSKQGWRSAEPEPMCAEEPRRFESLVFWGLAEDLFSPSRASEFLQRPIDQLAPALKLSTVSA